MVSMTRMTRILELDLANRCATVQPGLINLWLTNAVRDRGWFFAPDPSSQMVSSIGGNVATNAGGPHCLKYGITTNHVLGLEMVIGTGDVVSVGGKAADRPGYDLTGTMVGNEGTFGLVTAITVRLLHLPEAVKTALASFASLVEASEAVSAIIAAGIIPAALEMLDDAMIGAINAAVGKVYPDGAGAVLLIELDGPLAEVEAQAERVAAICRERQALMVTVARDETERALLWKGRKEAAGAVGRITAAYLLQDAVVPRSKLPQIMREMVAISKRHRLLFANVFHAGAEHLHEGGAPVDGAAPRWTAAPATIEQAAALVALAHDERLAVVPRGSGAALELGHPPTRVDLVLDTRRLDAVLEYNPDDLTVSVQAGCTAGALAARLAGRRQILPLDPPGWAARSLGGIAATQASGPLRQRYGTMRDLLLGVRFAQADGVLTWGGAKVVKSVSGYDVPKLMVGALGTLGVLLELTLRLHPAPDYEATWLASFRTPAHARECVAALLDSTVQTNRLEILDGRVLAACSLPVTAAALAVSIGTVEPAVRAQEGLVRAIVQRAQGTVQTMGASFWKTYDRALVGFDGVVLRIGSVPARLVETLGAVQALL